MDNFDIEGSTNSELGDEVRKSAHLNQHNNQMASQEQAMGNVAKILDTFDPKNCALSVSFKVAAIVM